MAWTPKVPECFGELAPNYGLMFACSGCTRATAFERDELIRRWGEEGVIREIAKRFRCRNCRRRGAIVEVRRGRIEKTEGDRVLERMDDVDRLVREIGEIKPSGTVS